MFAGIGESTDLNESSPQRALHLDTLRGSPQHVLAGFDGLLANGARAVGGGGGLQQFQRQFLADRVGRSRGAATLDGAAVECRSRQHLSLLLRLAGRGEDVIWPLQRRRVGSPSAPDDEDDDSPEERGRDDGEGDILHRAEA